MLPVPHHRVGVFGIDIAKDMRVTRTQFVVNVERNIGDRELTLFSGQLTVEQHLKEEIAKFFFKVLIARTCLDIEMIDGFKYFVGLFK